MSLYDSNAALAAPTASTGISTSAFATSVPLSNSGWRKGVKQSFPKKGTTVVGKLTDEKVREEISAIVLQFSDGQLAQAAGRTKECAKKIKRAMSAPSSATLLNLAQSIPCVNAWVLGKIAMNGERPESNPQMLIEVLTSLRRMSETDTPEGRALKVVFTELANGGA